MFLSSATRFGSSAVTTSGTLAAIRRKSVLRRSSGPALWQDPPTRLVVEPELPNPPSDVQKSPELALAGAVILGALISWLQTTIEIEMNRGKDGKLDFSFRLKKEATSGASAPSNSIESQNDGWLQAMIHRRHVIGDFLNVLQRCGAPRGFSVSEIPAE
jgi:hypothetical protein